MSMDHAISQVTSTLNMSHIKSQLEEAMFSGKMSLTFNRRDDHDPKKSLPTGDMHLMQAVYLTREGWKVERSSGAFTVSGWSDSVTV